MKAILCLGLILLLLDLTSAPPPIKQGCRKGRKRIHGRREPGKIVDLTYSIDENTAHWPAFPDYNSNVLFNDYVDLQGNRVFLAANEIEAPEHIGTHMDAPYHFYEEGLKVDAVSPLQVIGEGVLLDLTKNGEKMDRDALVNIKDFLDWEQVHGRIRTGSIILIRSGYGDFYSNREIYYGTNITGEESIPHLHYPGLSARAAEWLVTHRCIAAVGVDLMSLDCGQCTDFGAHIVLSENQVVIYENIANLQLLAGKSFDVIALPISIKGGTGAPARVIALLH